MSLPVSVETFASAGLLPADVRPLLDRPDGLFAGRGWWAVVLSDAMPDDAAAVFLVCRIGGIAAALVPLLRTGGRLDSLTTPYTCRYTPVFAPGLDRAARVAAMAAVARFCRRGAPTRLEALPAEWDGLPDLLGGCRQAGLWPLRFDHFGNWYEDVAGLDWAGYLARRPGALRETIRRRLRRTERMADVRFDLLTDPAQVDTAALAFEQVYAQSWKLPEPFPTFNVALIRALAADGMLRFGVLSVGAVPVAVQVWALVEGQATVLKLAHDEAFKALSPGTVLTALMLRHLLDQDHVRQIDFGRGDDPYKRDWAARRRQRIGLLLVDPWRPAGAAALLRHAVGRLRAALRRHKGDAGGKDHKGDAGGKDHKGDTGGKDHKGDAGGVPGEGRG